MWLSLFDPDKILHHTIFTNEIDIHARLVSPVTQFFGCYDSSVHRELSEIVELPSLADAACVRASR